MIHNWTIEIGMCTVLLAASACSFESVSNNFSCQEQLDCLDGRECREGWCVLPGAGDDAGRIDARDDTPDAGPDAAPPFESAPRAIVILSPAAGTPATTFSADATSSVDREDATNTLAFTWDWDNDGTFEGTGPSDTHSYANPGTYTLVLRAEDPGGLVGFKAFEIIVVADADLVTVSTTADESDTGATPSVPLGAGLSLREAIIYTNDTAGRQLILLPTGDTYAIDTGLPALDNLVGTDLVGDGAIINGTNSPQSTCLSLGGDDNTVLGVEIHSCKTDAIRASNGTDNNRVSRCILHDNPTAISSTGDGLVVGPDNMIFSNTAAGVDLSGPGQILNNTIRDTGGPAISLGSAADNTTIVGNDIYSNLVGIEFKTNFSLASVQHNTLDGNTKGLDVTMNVSLLDFRNNIVSRCSGVGIDGLSTNFVERDFNSFYANGGGDCGGCSLGSNSLDFKQQYIDISGADYRLRPTSPIIDQGADLGRDINGPRAGSFEGSAPDMGANESP